MTFATIANVCNATDNDGFHTHPLHNDLFRIKIQANQVLLNFISNLPGKRMVFMIGGLGHEVSLHKAVSYGGELGKELLERLVGQSVRHGV
jgi:hypothetical protein